ncbi:hypothetical protein [Mycolicibacterium sp. P1-5]|uniref:hypothetical protein n=1 Tax=Mycolicibacterium sp. P1-5 TaxID=2024617 RepID=UPI0011ECDC83|nr:hypothetical protein [Mycolicibacterium sp. P1-5]KAA0103002.1 hypothetical protein CIW47_23550 [Mycolicibacterium sp. P1-5]
MTDGRTIHAPANEFQHVQQLAAAAKWDRERRAGICDGAHDFSGLPANAARLDQFIGSQVLSITRG